MLLVTAGRAIDGIGASGVLSSASLAVVSTPVAVARLGTAATAWDAVTTVLPVAPVVMAAVAAIWSWRAARLAPSSVATILPTTNVVFSKVAPRLGAVGFIVPAPLVVAVLVGAVVVVVISPSFLMIEIIA